MWRQLKNLLAGRSRRCVSRSRMRAVARSRPEVEALEVRCVPTVAQGFGGGILTFRGDGNNDFVRLLDRGNGVVDFSYNGVGGVTMGMQPGVTMIQVSMRGGTDEVSYRLENNLIRPQRVSVDLGAGDDLFQAILAGNIGADLRMSVEGRGGEDTIAFEAGQDLNLVNPTDPGDLTLTDVRLCAHGGNDADVIRANMIDALRSVDIAARASLLIDLGGNRGGDTIDVRYRGELDGNFHLFAGGQQGVDTVSAILELTFGSTGTVAGTRGESGCQPSFRNPARVRGREGGDNLTFIICDNSVVPSPNGPFGSPLPVRGTNIRAEIQGVGGADTGTRTDNVIPRSIEDDRVVSACPC